MNWIELTGVVIGMLIVLVVSNRVRSTALIQKELLLLAARFKEEAGRRRVAHERPMVIIHDLFVDMAALAPAISSGVLELLAAKPQPAEPERNLVEENAWIGPYLLTAVLLISRLEFHAKPWRPQRMSMALVAWGISRACTSNGVVDLSRGPDRSAENLAKLRTVSGTTVHA